MSATNEGVTLQSEADADWEAVGKIANGMVAAINAAASLSVWLLAAGLVMTAYAGLYHEPNEDEIQEALKEAGLYLRLVHCHHPQQGSEFLTLGMMLQLLGAACRPDEELHATRRRSVERV